VRPRRQGGAAPRPVYVAGSGSFLPGKPLSPVEAERVLGELTSAPEAVRRWAARSAPVMRELLSVGRFHYAIDPVTREATGDNVTMAAEAARTALAAAGIDAEQIDLICYGSAHQDQMPTASVRIQEALGIEACDELSIHANCTSAYKALYLAHRLVESGRNDNALVLSAQVSSSELRAEYYNQALVDRESLFLRWFLGDGAGAVVLTARPERSAGFAVEQTYIESIGGKRAPHMFNLRPALWLNPRDEFERGLHHLRQRFRNSLATDVFQEPGGSIFLHGFERMIAECGVDLATIAFMQVNLPARHIAESVAEELERIGVPRGRVYTRLADLGYAGPPMALICLDHILREERLAPGARIASFVTEVSKFMQAGYVVARHA
jgi:3-oxoacyl-[acyl-carrier-protein] synthase III